LPAVTKNWFEAQNYINSTSTASTQTIIWAKQTGGFQISTNCAVSSIMVKRSNPHGRWLPASPPSKTSIIRKATVAEKNLQDIYDKLGISATPGGIQKLTM
jgi:hypothetical protein